MEAEELVIGVAPGCTAMLLQERLNWALSEDNLAGLYCDPNVVSLLGVGVAGLPLDKCHATGLLF